MQLIPVETTQMTQGVSQSAQASVPVSAVPILSNPLRPANFRRAPGIAVNGRSSSVEPSGRSSSAHRGLQRSISKEAIPLAQLSGLVEPQPPIENDQVRRQSNRRT